MTSRVKKRCEKCGAVSLAKPRQRHCYRRTFGLGSYCCWGRLVRVVRPRPSRPTADGVPTPSGLGVGWQLSEDADQARIAAFRKRAVQDLATARRKLMEKTQQAARLGKQVGQWARREAEAAKRAALTDEQIAALRAKRQAAAAKGMATRAKPVRRSIKVGGGVL